MILIVISDIPVMEDEKLSLQVPRVPGLQISSSLGARPSDVLAYEEEDGGGLGAMGYQQTLMYGRYSRSLGEELREEMKRQKMLEKTHRKEFRKIKNELRGRGERQDKLYSVLSFIWRHTFAQVQDLILC